MAELGPTDDRQHMFAGTSVRSHVLAAGGKLRSPTSKRYARWSQSRTCFHCPSPRVCLPKDYDGDRFRESPRSNRKAPARRDDRRYKDCNRIERGMR